MYSRRITSNIDHERLIRFDITTTVCASFIHIYIPTLFLRTSMYEYNQVSTSNKHEMISVITNAAREMIDRRITISRNVPALA